MADDIEEIDSQLILENVAFLDKCFDCSFLPQSSLVSVKEFVTEEEQTNNLTKANSSKRNDTLLFNKTQIELNVNQTLSQSIAKFSQCQPTVSKKLSDWGMPQEIVRKYESRGITEMFDWQVSCLSNTKVIIDNCNLVYSAPTSAGKTLVAEILTIKTIFERQKKVIFILPFVSIVREKTNYLQDVLSSSGIRVEGFMGSQSPPGGLSTVHVAICTIEKANSLVNKLLDEGNISDLGAIIVDELHLLGDTSRGYILELLLTKVKFVTSKFEDTVVQIVGMSATLPNLNILATWLEAELYITQFRPIPLDEYCLIEKKFFDTNGKNIGKIDDTELACYNNDLLLKLCIDTIKEDCSILIFCMTKNRCENIAQTISSSFYKMGCSGSDLGIILRKQLNTELILEVLEQLKSCPVGLDQVLKNTISFGVAYHHAGLTFDERDIIEAGFKNGSIRVLVATSTLSSGVNLPARKVIIRSPMFQRKPINIMTYKQMIGRAGRMGKDSKGESFLLCTEAESKIGLNLMKGDLEPVKSCINSDDKFMRAILEMIASGITSTFTELELYCQCTLLSAQETISDTQASLLQTTLDELKNYELIRTQMDDEETKYYATLLGKACLSSSMAPNDGLSLFCELQRARQCLVLETDLHLIYLVTPYSVSSQWGDIDWLHLLTLWESLTRAMKKVGELVGVQESFIIRCVRGTSKQTNVQKVNIHKRFYTALALQDLVNEVPLHEVAAKFRCARGFLQSLQQAAATFAGMVTVFCHQLGWKNMEILISQFQDRLHFGIHSELLELMKLPSLNGIRARSLYDAGFETLTNIASGDTNAIENALLKAIPFQSEARRDDDDDNDIRKRNKIKNVWVTGSCGMTVKEAANNLIKEARCYLEKELGVVDINWKTTETGNQDNNLDIKNELIANDVVIKNHDDDDKIAAEFKSIVNQEILTQITENKTVSVNSIDEIHKLESCCNLDYENKVTKENISVKHEPNSSFDILSEEIDFTQIKPNVCLDIVSNIVKREEAINYTEQKPETVLKIDKKEITKVIESNIKTSSPIVDTIKSKEIIEWETLNLSDNILPTNKERVSEGIFTPEVSLSEETREENAHETLRQKDISLFSTDGENSSIFEDSFPIDAIPSKLLNINSKTLVKSEIPDDILTIDPNSILNAFKTTLGSKLNNNNSLLDDDEDIKLVYDDESDFDTRKIENSKISNKRENSTINFDDDQPAFKRAKTLIEINKTNDFVNLLEKRSITMPNKKVLSLYHIKEHKHLSKIENLKHVSIYINIEKNKTIKEIIGINILNQNESNSNKSVKESRNKIKGISIYAGCDEIYYLDIENSNNHDMFIENIIKWLGNKSLRVVLLSSRYNLLIFLEYLNMELPSSCFDVCVAEWLINCDEKEPSMIYLAKKYCYVDINNTISTNMLENTCMKCWALWQIAEKQERCLEKLFPHYELILDIETKISIILSRCEHIGLNIDKELVSNMLLEVKNTQEIIQKKAYKVCGYHFNFNSSKDVAKVLGIYRGRKISTKKSVLTSHNSPMSSIIIYWRKLNSILTKTLYPLTEKAFRQSEDNRIHPSYTTFTCTGRVSMHEPNLQNVPRTFAIPIKYLNLESRITLSEETKEFNCRDIFKASPGFVLVSADYCQLEMRVLTHYCDDEVLMRIMKSDDDVFKLIAAEWGDVGVDQVDDDLRQKAKQLCYGIIYGMGNKTLSQQLDVTEMEAAIFMDSFHKSYPSIKVFTASVIEGCKKKGYIETLMKRRRYLPDINSRIVSKRCTAERQAVNTTIQGSAADIAKSAMCSIDKRISLFTHIQPRLILQMHDELIYEVPNSLKNEFINILRYEMENTVTLKVPLPVRLKIGPSWGSIMPL